MKTLKVLFAVALLSVGLMAQQHQGQHQTVNSNNTVTNSHNVTATGGNASSYNGGNSATMGVTTSMTSGGTDVSTNVPRQAPPAFAPDAYPSAPCRVSGSAGGSSPYFGFSIGGSKLDKDCAKRELARLLLAAGQRQAAVDALCSTQAAKGIANCNQLEVGPEPTPPPVVVPQPQEVTLYVEPIDLRFKPMRVEPIVVQPLPPERPVHVIVEQHHVRKHKACPTGEK
jgi:hypothetical protein